MIFGRDALDPEANRGLKLKHHRSSPDVCRSVCGKCRVSVSYWCETARRAGLGKWDIENRGWKYGETVVGVGLGQCSSRGECVDQEIRDAWEVSPKLIKTLREHME